MKRKMICLLLASVLCLSAAACSNEVAPAGNSTASGSSAQNNTDNKNAEVPEKKYQWDINGDMEMHWETNDKYLQYVKVSDEACPMADDDGKTIISMKSIFPSWMGWDMNGFSETKIIPYHFEASADLGETAKENDEYFDMWGGMAYRPGKEDSGEEVIKDTLSYYLYGDRAKDANEGTLVTTGLRTKEFNGHKVMYVRMQFEYDHNLYNPDKVVKMCVQRTCAAVEVESSAEGVLYFEVMIDEFRMTPDEFSDDSIIDMIFENVIFE